MWAGFEVKSVLHDGPSHRVLRAVRTADGRPVILKHLRAGAPPELLARLRHEFEVASRIPGPGVLRPLGFERIDSDATAFLVFPDLNAVSLRQNYAGRPVPARAAVSLTLQLAQALGRVHAAGFRHGDVNPANVLLAPAAEEAHPEESEVWLCDFGLAASLDELTVDQTEILGTLAYLAPEQVGRTSRAPDHRSDLYALGASLYELLTGQPPFDTTDPLALIHAHLAARPLPPLQRLPSVPPVLSDLVLKLLAKNPEERYQSAFGLAQDLRRIQSGLQAAGRAEPFALGAHDVPARFALRPGLYGRRTECAALQVLYARVAQGEKKALMITGPSGVGKSALVEELRRHVTAQGGLFLLGKYDQLRRNIPLSALSQAGEAFARRLLAAPAAELALWAQTLKQALGNVGQVLLDLVPIFELVLGPQLAIAELGPVETERRLNRVVGNVLGAIASAEHPLVLFLDDLQWADGASLRLLEALLTSEARPYMLLLGAYRDQEIDGLHPLTSVLAAAAKFGSPVESLALGPLPQSAVAELIAASLHATQEAVRPLSALVLDKTDGAPFFVGEFLSSLARRELVRFDPEVGRWTWDLDELRRQSVTENVANLLARRFLTLPERTQRVLRDAACLGATFPLSWLAQVTDQIAEPAAAQAEHLAQLLAPAVGAGLLLVDRERSEATGASVWAAGLTQESVLVFQHDRVQQAAYESIPEAEQASVHLRLGQRLRRGTDAEIEGRLFDVVQHLNLGARLLDSVAERVELAALNLRAARKARSSAAHEPARRFLDSALSLLPADGWQSCYELTLEIHLERAQAAIALCLFDEVLQTRDLVLRRARTPLHRARVLELQVRSLAIQGHTSEAIDTAVDALEALGVSLPKHPFVPMLLVDFARVRLLRGSSSLEDLRTAPVITDPALDMALRILAALLVTTASKRPLLMPFVLLTMLRLTFCHGCSPQAPVAYVMYGLVLCVLGDLEGTIAFGTLAMKLLERFPTTPSRGLVEQVVAGSMGPLRQPLSECIRLGELAAAGARDAGDVETDGVSISTTIYYTFCWGISLKEQRLRALATLQQAHKTRHEMAQTSGSLALRVVEDLTTRPGTQPERGRSLHDPEFLQELERKQEALSLAGYWGLRGTESYLRCDFAEAWSCFANYDRLRQALWGTHSVPFLDTYSALAKLSRYPELSWTQRAAARAAVLRIHWGLKKRARFAPQNYSHLERLLAAEWNRVSGGPLAVTRALYQEAAARARAHGSLREEALAQELLSRLLTSRGDELGARSARQAAYRLYQDWGAGAVLHRLEAAWPELREPLPANPSAGLAPPGTLDGAAASAPGSSSAAGLQLELTAVLRAAQALSGEIVLSKLLSTLLRTLLEAAGAVRGVLLLREGSTLYCAAEAGAGGVTAVEISPTAPVPAAISESAPVALSLVRYVERSGEEIILEHSRVDPRFANDPYLLARPPCALLALPLQRQGTLTGILYLENDVTSGAFTPARVQVARLLASQAAISLENAKLYAAQHAYAQTLEQQVQARTRDLQAALDRLHGELADAASYVRSRLPLPLPDGGKVAADWLFVPSLELGGDAFDYFFVDEDRFVLYLLDVSGHGVGPSLLALAVLRCLREQGMPGVDLCDPSAVCRALNQRFCSEAYGGRYFTLFYAVMDLPTRTLRYVQAGHPPAFLQSADGSRTLTLTSEGAMIGVMEDLEFPTAECTVEPDARLYVFSDGVYEVMGPDKPLWPFKQFCAELLRDPPARISRPQALETMLQLARAHRGSQALADDFSFLAFDFPGRLPAAGT